MQHTTSTLGHTTRVANFNPYQNKRKHETIDNGAHTQSKQSKTNTPAGTPNIQLADNDNKTPDGTRTLPSWLKPGHALYHKFASKFANTHVHSAPACSSGSVDSANSANR